MNTTGRRSFLANSTLIGAGLTSLSLLRSVSAAEKEPISKPGNEKRVETEEEFRLGVIGPAELSLVTSKIAVEKATDKNTKEFAEFELTEAIAVTTVLKDLGTPVPPMDANAKKILETLKTADKGKAFDMAYIAAQVKNHEFLRDHAENYLEHSDGKGAAEKQGRHLATLSLAVFKEHVAITSRIAGELKM